MESIIQNEKECYVTGAKNNLHRHHVFFGRGIRQLSEKYGLTIWLTSELHNLSNESIHNNKKFDLKVKRTVQKKAMERYNWSIEDFIKIFGRNYIE